MLHPLGCNLISILVINSCFNSVIFQFTWLHQSLLLPVVLIQLFHSSSLGRNLISILVLVSHVNNIIIPLILLCLTVPFLQLLAVFVWYVTHFSQTLTICIQLQLATTLASVRINDFMIAKNIASIATCNLILLFCLQKGSSLALRSDFLHCAGPYHIWIYNLGTIKDVQRDWSHQNTF